MKFPHSLKFFEIPDHVRRPAGLFDADCKLGALEEFRFQLLPAHRLSGMAGRRRLDFLQNLAVFEANGDAGVEVLEASSLDLRIHYVPTTLHHLLNFRALDYLVPELGDAHLAPQNGDCQEEWEREHRFERGLGISLDPDARNLARVDIHWGCRWTHDRSYEGDKTLKSHSYTFFEILIPPAIAWQGTRRLDLTGERSRTFSDELLVDPIDYLTRDLLSLRAAGDRHACPALRWPLAGENSSDLLEVAVYLRRYHLGSLGTL